ncbi:hypothetical protein SAMN05444156_0936 [Verrucomicrobium sp. GAS474]|uniref:hypothetical protein n=1 Tax=Verrucomicrobium sp. GAS474 TaxID=1882831 RepID=UPI00087C7B6F|nr:hypothetical protein [Verrucomicrobium sp. GAS474]SDT94223.1 hypothetical protein SAMN05444156_0936 [Verrucomicrobium sp. GAS474]
MALVLVLSLLALVSVLIMSFFGQAAANRQISFASSGQERADLLAVTALQTILGDLRDEIRAGSTETAGTAGTPVYLPTTNLNMLPQAVVAAGLTNLIKESLGGSNLWSGARYQFAGPIRSYVGDSSLNPSVNGRYISLARWQRPSLLTSAENALMRAPDWVPVTRQGPLTNAPAVPFGSLTNSTAGNSSYVVGRYAYTVYDIGGLLDANVAGYGSQTPLTASDIARKGSLATVPLVGIGNLTQAQVDALVKWRTSGVVTNYSSYLIQLGSTNGFITPAPGNQAFLSRQDLIHYAVANGITNALPFLTSFSREKNSPSWKPAKPTDSTIDYASLAETSSAANRDLANLRATDGTALIQSRFDLDRLAWLTFKGPSANLPVADPLYNATGTDTNIKKYFGLVWDTTAYSPTTEHGEQWVYTSPDGAGLTPSMILTLQQVATKKRQPDFFELLKAGILSGSLGLCSDGEKNAITVAWGADSTALHFRVDTAVPAQPYNQVPDYQVFNIAANILGQYSSDNYPSFILTPGGNAIGQKSLPYKYAHGNDVYRPPVGTTLFGGNPYRADGYFWLRFLIWNPTRNAALAPPATGPTSFRVIPVRGKSYGCFWGLVNAPTARDFSQETATLSFPSSTAFIDPQPLTGNNTTAASDNVYGPDIGRHTDGTRDMCGIFLGKHTAPDSQVPESAPLITANPNLTNSIPNNPQIPMKPGQMAAPSPFDIRYQYLDWKNRWRSYQIDYNTFMVRGVAASLRPYTSTATLGQFVYASPDPRDRRLGPTDSHSDSDNSVDATNSFRYDASHYRSSNIYLYTPSSRFHNINGTYARYAAYADNQVSLLSDYYSDPDGVIRPGDAGGRGPLPLAVNATAGASRPLILNAPFHSSADLGYTYRDLPWKSLDFCTALSADTGLLDLFELRGGGTNSIPIAAGRVNLNSAPKTVLQALLKGAAVDYGPDLKTVGTTLSSSDVTTLVNALRPVGGPNPVFLNKADLVGFFSTNMPPAYTIKAQREAGVRAMNDVVSTRTWNLLIDVVAQSGRYPTGASGVGKFLVEGEKHYWLQVAIDRFTGEIVSQQAEAVYED